MKRYKKVVGGLAVASVVALGAALVYAPYLPRLAEEGYPQLNWPAPGSFVTVGKAETASPSSGQHKASLSQSPAKAELNQWSEKLFSEKGGKALLVYQGGRLVVEHYAKGFGKDSRFNSYSMVKSLVGVMVLKAVAEQKIASLSDPIGQYLPEMNNKTLASTPLSLFLRMRSGILFEPGGGKAAFGGEAKDINSTKLNPFGPMVRLHMKGVNEVMGGLVSDKKRWGQYDYQNINTALLGRVLAKIYGQPLEKILNDKIWRPAQASQKSYWRRYDQAKPVTAYCCLYARARDWVKLGHYIMTNGKGSGRPFLPEKLWRLYMGLDIAVGGFGGKSKYGAHIYHNILDREGQPLQGKFSYMFGSRGQIVYMMPQKDLVVVRFGEQIQLLHSTLYAAWSMVKENRL